MDISTLENSLIFMGMGHLNKKSTNLMGMCFYQGYNEMQKVAPEYV